MRRLSILFTIMLIFSSNAQAFGPYEREDLKKHYAASMLSTIAFYSIYRTFDTTHGKALLGAAVTTLLIGLAKEVLIDAHFDRSDVAANASGIAGGAILTIPVSWSFE